jgi:hypothetical protein
VSTTQYVYDLKSGVQRTTRYWSAFISPPQAR